MGSQAFRRRFRRFAGRVYVQAWPVLRVTSKRVVGKIEIDLFDGILSG